MIPADRLSRHAGWSLVEVQKMARHNDALGAVTKPGMDILERNDGIMGRSGSFQLLNLRQIQHSSVPIFPALFFQEVLRCERVLLEFLGGRARFWSTRSAKSPAV